MTRRVPLGLMLVVSVLFLCAGCPERTSSVPATEDADQNPNIKGDMEFRVKNWVERLTNGPDGYPRRRRTAAIQAGNAANNPNLTPEMRARLIEALQKMIENEPKANASEETRQSIIAEGKKALAALQ